MFSPLDILYIVLAFSVLWLTAAIFWLIWQVASIFRTANETLHLAQDTLGKIENALDGIKSKFESATGALGLVVTASTQVVDYLLEKRKKPTRSRKKKKASEDVIDV